MDFFNNPAEVVSMASLILLLLLQTHRALDETIVDVLEDDNSTVVVPFPKNLQRPLLDEVAMSRVVLQQFRLWTSVLVFDEELGFWVKPRSTTWFTKFLLEEYDDERWIQMFRMTKRALLSLAELLAPFIRRRDTNYRLAIPVTVRMACTLFKLCHGVSLLICSELFAIGRSTVSVVLRDVVQAVNVGLRGEIQWPMDDGVPEVEAGFQQACGLPGILGAIDGTHFPIAKPKIAPADYFYFKSGGYSMHCQAVVDSTKRFLNVTVGMPGSTNDSRVLRRSALYHRGQQGNLWDAAHLFQGFQPYLIGDSGYPLLRWLMVPHRQNTPLPVAAALFNRGLSRGRAVVENAFGMMKQAFRELHKKSELHITFIPDVVLCCAILHNILLKDSHEDMERLLRVLQAEAIPCNVEGKGADREGAGQVPVDYMEEEAAIVRRQDLGVFLTLQRLQAL